MATHSARVGGTVHNYSVHFSLMHKLHTKFGRSGSDLVRFFSHSTACCYALLYDQLVTNINLNQANKVPQTYETLLKSTGISVREPISFLMLVLILLSLLLRTILFESCSGTCLKHHCKPMSSCPLLQFSVPRQKSLIQSHFIQ